MDKHPGSAEAGWLNRDLLVNTRRKQTGAMCPATRSSQAENGSIPVQAASGAAKKAHVLASGRDEAKLRMSIRHVFARL